MQADADAVYHKELRLDVSSVRPCVSGPNSVGFSPHWAPKKAPSLVFLFFFFPPTRAQVKVMSTVEELERKSIKIHKAYLVSCVNSRVADIAAAAEVMRGKHVAPVGDQSQFNEWK